MHFRAIDRDRLARASGGQFEPVVPPQRWVKTKMNCVKRLGLRLMSRDFDRQVAEVQIRAAVMNRFTALGIPVHAVRLRGRRPV
ncbi:hypothetical protein DPM13_05435 [Paracoccus mutanolyticus]|uniref:Transposase DDE domain-containing protein n=1 Tax=Paracoccus mutanolyticus TaxID=1499308 RepID=A0ABN5M5R8_9RHOB|nr:hypothetical protein DPM13_05435 [Paracoccus mutanolyticus]